MTEDRTQPQIAMELSERWNAYHNSVNFIPAESYTQFTLSPFIEVEWFAGAEDGWERGFWLSFDGADTVHKVTNVVRMHECVKGADVLTGLRVETDDGFSVNIDLDPITLKGVY